MRQHSDLGSCLNAANADKTKTCACYPTFFSCLKPTSVRQMVSRELLRSVHCSDTFSRPALVLPLRRTTTRRDAMPLAAPRARRPPAPASSRRSRSHSLPRSSPRASSDQAATTNRQIEKPTPLVTIIKIGASFFGDCISRISRISLLFTASPQIASQLNDDCSCHSCQ
jgi:hypothetical protein